MSPLVRWLPTRTRPESA